MTPLFASRRKPRRVGRELETSPSAADDEEGTSSTLLVMATHSDFAISQPPEADCVLQTPAQSSEGQPAYLNQNRNYEFLSTQKRSKPLRTTHPLMQTQERTQLYEPRTSPAIPRRRAVFSATPSLLHPAHPTRFPFEASVPHPMSDRPTARIISTSSVTLLLPPPKISPLTILPWKMMKISKH